MSDFLEEIKEDLQYEKFFGFWKQYQNYIVNGSVAILLIASAYAGWQYYQSNKNNDLAKIYHVATFEADTTQRQNALEKLKQVSEAGYTSYADLARLKAAGILADKKEIQSALDLYQNLKKSNYGGDIYENFAIINAGYLALDNAKDDSFLEPLEPLCKEGNPWRGSALELKGLYYIKQQNWAAALPVFETILKDSSITQTLKVRASKLHVYVLEQQQQK